MGLLLSTILVVACGCAGVPTAKSKQRQTTAIGTSFLPLERDSRSGPDNSSIIAFVILILPNNVVTTRGLLDISLNALRSGL